MEDCGDMTEEEKTELLLRAFYVDQSRLRGYIFTATRDYHATEEILQSTAITIAQKSATFDFSKEMSPWFSGIVRNLILRWFQTQGKAAKHVSLDVIEQCVAEPEDFESGVISTRQIALKSCIQKLPVRQRKIVQLRYVEGKDCSGIAAELGRSVQSIYALLKRMKLELRKCVEVQLNRHEVAS